MSKIALTKKMAECRRELYRKYEKASLAGAVRLRKDIELASSMPKDAHAGMIDVIKHGAEWGLLSKEDVDWLDMYYSDFGRWTMLSDFARVFAMNLAIRLAKAKLDKAGSEHRKLMNGGGRL